MDAVPVWSQAKSLVQYITRNREGARQTQINFLKLCPVVSQCRSLVQAINGDEEGARETQTAFLKGLNGMVDSVPGLGHAKAAVHYICGDKEGGSNAWKASTRSVGVIGGGVGGFLVGGPVGAVVGGTLGGAYTDCIISTVNLVNGENGKLYGVCDNILHIIEDPTDGGNYVDLVGGIVLDGVMGGSAGTGIGKLIQNDMEKRHLVNTFGNEGTKVIIDTGEKMRKYRSTNKIQKKKPHVTTQAKDRVTGKTAIGHNKSVRLVPLPDEPTELQNRVPDAKPVLDRAFSNCAEHQAYDEIYKARPEALPADLSSASVKWHHKSKRIVTVPSCRNCKEFSSAMGTVYTDASGEINLPLKVGVCTTAAYIGVGVGVPALKNGFKKQHK